MRPVIGIAIAAIQGCFRSDPRAMARQRQAFSQPLKTAIEKKHVLGRKRKNGHRQPNGKLKPPPAPARRDGERAIVLAQPHRRGFGLDQLAESPLGRLVLRRRLPRNVFYAALEWGSFVRKWQNARGIRIEVHVPGVSDGRVLPDKVVWSWQKRILRIESLLKKMSRSGFLAMRTLVVHEREIDRDDEQDAAQVLRRRAKLTRSQVEICRVDPDPASDETATIR
jgi:hypothetical protein